MDYREHEFLTVYEVADILRMGKSKCYDLVNSPGCPFKVLKIGRLTRVPANSFYKWYDSLAEKEGPDRRR